MNIVVNARLLLKDYLEGMGNFLAETMKIICIQHPEHHFIFVFDRPYDEHFIFSDNITPVVAGPPARHPLLWKYWFDVKIPAILRKYKADVFVSSDGFCSLATKRPQCLVIHDLAFLHDDSYLKKSYTGFYKKYTPKFLNKARSIATVSEFSKKEIVDHYQVDAAKIDVVYNGVKEVFQPVSEKDKQVIKEKYTGGAEYFLYTGSIHPRKNLMNLLKAFSIFKKRLKSNLKLVIAGRLAWKYESFVESLKTYKYRSDVVLTGYLPEEELALLTASAYAMVYPSFIEGFGVPVAEAMKCGVQVITTLHSAMQEVCGEAGLYAEAQNFNDIADKMMLIYKDEVLRKQLVDKGRELVKKYSWQTTANLFWQTILKAVD
ncbi:MAG: glycosyltransferase family 1 protein [Chitinophagaceae bacterium]